MLLRLLIISLLLLGTFSSTFANMSCNYQIINNRCTCTFLIFNPAGNYEINILGNPVPNCGLNEVVDAVGSGITTNIPVTICNSFRNLESLIMKGLSIETLNQNPFGQCYNLKNLDLGNNKIQELTSLMFANTKLEKVSFDLNWIRNVSSAAFVSVSSLKSLSIIWNYGIELPEDVFDPLVNLQTLILSNNRLNHVKTSWLRNLRNLTTIDLSVNEITTFDEFLFHQTPHLYNIDISRNMIRSLSAVTFQNNTNLMNLNIRFNGMNTALPSNLFGNNRRLSSLFLSINPFPSIPLDLFEPLTELKDLDMSYAGITTLQSSWFKTLENLYYLNLQGNSLTTIPINSFSAIRNLVILDLSRTSLTIINSRSFGDLSLLEKLYLEENALVAIDHYFINQTKNLLHLNLNGNSCANLDADNFSINRTTYMEMMRGCFDNFDVKPVELTTTNNDIYEWFNVRSDEGWDAIEVSIAAPHRAHIGLTDINRGEALVEIRFGENYNQETNIVERGDVIMVDNVINRLNSTDPVKFIIGWRFNAVLVFADEERMPFLIHFMKQPFPVNFFGARSLIDPRHQVVAKWKISRMRTV